MAAGASRMNAGEAFLCAGVERMSRVPMTGYNPLPHPGRCDTYPPADRVRGESADIVNWDETAAR